MRLPLTRLENITLTIRISPLTISPLCLLVRLGDYIVNLCVFYFYKLITKLTVSFQLQEFSLSNITVSVSPHNSSPRLGKFSLRIQHYGLLINQNNLSSKLETLNYSKRQLIYCESISSQQNIISSKLNHF